MTIGIGITIIITILSIGILCFIILAYNRFEILFLDLRKLFSGRTKPNDVGNYYNQWNEKYLKYYGDTIQAHRPQDIDELHQYILTSSGIASGMKILDAGCGVCGPSIYFASQKHITIEAITISEAQAETAKHNISKKNLEDKINVTVADFHHADQVFPENHFDMVLFLESYGHSTYQKQVIKAAVKVLKKNGFIYIKDYFKKEFSGNSKRKTLMQTGIKNMNKEYCYNLANLYFTIHWLKKEKLELVFIKAPDFKMDNIHVVNAFENAYGIDLFEGQDKPHIVEPLELLFRKV